MTTATTPTTPTSRRDISIVEATKAPTPAPVRVFLNAATPADNLGDVVIVRQLLKLTRAFGATVDVDSRALEPQMRTLVGAGEDESATVSSFLFRAMRQRIRPQRKPESFVLLLKPGHIGGKYSPPALAARVGLLGVTAVARSLGVNVVRVGFSVDNLAPAMLAIERTQSRLMTTYAPRDSGSVTYAHDAGLTVTERSTDLAFSLPVRQAEAPRYDLALSLRSSLLGGPAAGPYQDRVLAVARGLVTRAQQESASVVWCAQVTRDRAVAELALLEHPDVPIMVFDGTVRSADVVLDTYARSRILVSNRLHAVLLALSQGIPALAVTDLAAHGKLTNLLRDVGLGGLLVDIESGPDEIWQRARALTRDSAEVMAQVREAFRNQVTVLDEAVRAWGLR
jgi:polysaccharide pyruvyl transferase WcaK-like protein